MLHSTVDKSRLRGKDEVLGKGGFGTVYRVKMYKVYRTLEAYGTYNCHLCMILIVEGE